MSEREQASLFDNGRILAWMNYFSDKTELDLEKIKLIDISVKNKNLIPAVEANRCTLVFTGAGHQNLFYDMWVAGLGECDVWLKAGLDPQGDVSCRKVRDCINSAIDEPSVLLFVNARANSAYKIGLRNDNFSSGSVRYVSREIRAVIMSMLSIQSQDTICIVSGESIAVEAAMIAGEGAVIAVEYNSSDRASMEENVNKFGLNNVQIIPDAKPETLRAVPVPQTAFIVATEHLEDEIREFLRLNPNMRFMIYTLELNILTKIPGLFEKYEIHDMEIVQIALSKLNKKSLFEAQPAPWIISGYAGAGQPQ